MPFPFDDELSHDGLGFGVGVGCFVEREGMAGGSPDGSESGEGTPFPLGGRGVGGATGIGVSDGERVVTMGQTACSGSVKAVYGQVIVRKCITPPILKKKLYLRTSPNRWNLQYLIQDMLSSPFEK